MWLKEIIIEDYNFDKLNDQQWKVNFKISPISDDWDLEPAVWLKILINWSLLKILTSDEMGKVEDEFIINHNQKNCELQVVDVEEIVRSKIKKIFVEEQIPKFNSKSIVEWEIVDKSKVYHEKQQKIDRKKVLLAVSKNGLILWEDDYITHNKDREIVEAAVKQNWDALLYVDSFFLKDFDILTKAYMNKEPSIDKVLILNNNDSLIIDYIQKVQKFFLSGDVSDNNLMTCIKENRDIFYFMAKKSAIPKEMHLDFFSKILKIIPAELWDDKNFILEFCENIRPNYFDYLPYKVTLNREARLLSLKNMPIGYDL